MEGFVSPGQTYKGQAFWLAVGVVLWMPVAMFFVAHGLSAGVWITVFLAVVFGFIGWRRLQRGPSWFRR